MCGYAKYGAWREQNALFWFLLLICTCGSLSVWVLSIWLHDYREPVGRRNPNPKPKPNRVPITRNHHHDLTRTNGHPPCQANSYMSLQGGRVAASNFLSSASKALAAANAVSGRSTDTRKSKPKFVPVVLPQLVLQYRPKWMQFRAESLFFLSCVAVCRVHGFMYFTASPVHM